MGSRMTPAVRTWTWRKLALACLALALCAGVLALVAQQLREDRIEASRDEWLARQARGRDLPYRSKISKSVAAPSWSRFVRRSLIKPFATKTRAMVVTEDLARPRHRDPSASPYADKDGIRKVREAKMARYKEDRKIQCDDQGKWVTSDLSGEKEVEYFYEDSMFNPEVRQYRPVGVQTCEVEDEGGDSGWLIHRIGPFVGVGGYDRHDITINRLPHPRKAKFITGKMTAPVYHDGTIAGFPPLHSHHMMIGFSGVYHALESHGDAVCSQDYGAESCYLISYPEGVGLPFVGANDTTGRNDADFLTLTIVFNDVRRRNETLTPSPLLFYGEVALKWSARASDRPISAAALHMQGEEHGYAANIVTKRPSLRWNTGKWPVDGRLIISPKDQMPWFHAHRSYFTGFWAFAASPRQLGLEPEKLLMRVDDNSTNAGPLGRFDWVWTPKDPIAALTAKVRGSEAGMESLRCWMVASDEEKILEFVNETDASEAYREPWRQHWKGSWYDRSGEVHCDPWSFKAGDNYTVVAMNGIDDRYNWTHDQSDFFTMMQHGIFFLNYETEGDDVGPTMEVFGDFDTDLANDVKIKWSYVPKELQGSAEDHDWFHVNNTQEYDEVLDNHFNLKLDTNLRIIRQESP